MGADTSSTYVSETGDVREHDYLDTKGKRLRMLVVCMRIHTVCI
jgi:hypothetical protein